MEETEMNLLGPITSALIAQDSNESLRDTEVIPNNCHPGLQFLADIDQLLIYQQVELIEIVCGFETNNKYVINNILGETVYYAEEDTNCLRRNFFGSMRAFNIKIMDNSGNEAIHLNRPLRCTYFCFPCCLQTMEVSAPPSTLIAQIEQEWSFFFHKLIVRNAAGDIMFRIEAPAFKWCCNGNNEYQVLSADRQQTVGKISKQWAGIVQEFLTDATNFQINFTKELDVKWKAALLGACILIDFMFFEKSVKAVRNHCCGCEILANR